MSKRDRATTRWRDVAAGDGCGGEGGLMLWWRWARDWVASRVEEEAMRAHKWRKKKEAVCGL